jgi:hypothetical protein
VMRICPTCGDMVAATLRCCPRCAGPLPEPRTGYPGGPGYLPAPYLAESDYSAEPGYPAEPGYGPEPYGPPWYGPAAYEDDPGPEAFGDRFAGAGPETGGFRAWAALEPEPVPEEDPASRLPCAPPGRRHRARIAGAVLGTVALMAGVIAAWAVLGQRPGGQRLGLLGELRGFRLREEGTDLAEDPLVGGPLLASRGAQPGRGTGPCRTGQRAQLGQHRQVAEHEEQFHRRYQCGLRAVPLPAAPPAEVSVVASPPHLGPEGGQLCQPAASSWSGWRRWQVNGRCPARNRSPTEIVPSDRMSGSVRSGG